VKVWPPIVIVPVRELVFGLEATLKLTDPLPLPLAPAVTVSQLVALLIAVQPQPVPAVIVIEPVVAAEDVRFDDVGEIVYAHGTVKANVFDRGVDAEPPGPTALRTDS